MVSVSWVGFGLNIVWVGQAAKSGQIRFWPGLEVLPRRYEYCTEYVKIMRELWETGRSDFKGAFFQMDDCRLSPRPDKPIQIIGAAQSDNGTRFAAETCDYNFCASFGINEPTRVAPSVARLVAAA